MKQKWNNYYLSTDYFEVIRINDTFIEFRSRNTKHQKRPTLQLIF